MQCINLNLVFGTKVKFFHNIIVLQSLNYPLIIGEDLWKKYKYSASDDMTTFIICDSQIPIIPIFENTPINAMIYPPFKDKYSNPDDEIVEQPSPNVHKLKPKQRQCKSGNINTDTHAMVTTDIKRPKTVNSTPSEMSILMCLLSEVLLHDSNN